MAGEFIDGYGNRYEEFLKHFSEAYEHPVELLKEKIANSSKKEISVLSIGAGDGRFERLWTNSLDEKVKIKHFDLYDADSVHYEMIKKIDWKECVEESRAFNEAVNVDTQFPREYDVILLSHVMYYFLTEDKIRSIFEKLVQNLAPGGIICIIQCCWSKDQRISDQIRLVAAFPHLPEWNYESPCSQAETLHWAFNPVIQEFNLNSDLHKKDVHVTLNGLDDEALPSALTTLSILFGHHDLNEIPDEEKSRLKGWIMLNLSENPESSSERITLTLPQAVLLYSKPR